MRIVARYLITDVLKSFIALSGILLFIAISNRFVRLLSSAVTGEISPSLLLQLTSLYIPDLIAFLMPLGLFMAILLSFSRAFVDQEIPVMFACGVSWGSLAKWCLGLSFLLVWIVAAISLYVGPKIEDYKVQLLGQQDPELMLASLAPGRFHSFLNNKVVFYVEGFSQNRRYLKEVFIAEQPRHLPEEGEAWSVITASSGETIKDENGQMYLELKSGARYNGTPGEKDYSIVDFERYGRLIEHKPVEGNTEFHRNMSTWRLWGSDQPGEQAELQWRLALPISMPILALLAIPLSRVSPRKGRFAKILPALILYIIYYNLLTLARRWVGSGELSPLLGLWWVHGLFFCLALGLIAQASGQLGSWWARLRSSK